MRHYRAKHRVFNTKTLLKTVDGLGKRDSVKLAKFFCDGCSWPYKGNEDFFNTIHRLGYSYIQPSDKAEVLRPDYWSERGSQFEWRDYVAEVWA